MAGRRSGSCASSRSSWRRARCCRAERGSAPDGHLRSSPDGVRPMQGRRGRGPLDPYRTAHLHLPGLRWDAIFAASRLPGPTSCRGRASTLSGTGALPFLVAALPLLVAFLTTYLHVPPVRRFASEWRLGDKPNGRKLHAQAIPHLGGIAIFGGFFLAMLVILATPIGVHHAARVLALLPGLLIVFGLGLVDDLRGARAGVKLAYQLLGAVCIVSMGAGLAAEGAPDAWMAVLSGASVLWYVGVCNGVNLIDGLDGLAAGVAGIAALAFAVVGLQLGDGEV